MNARVSTELLAAAAGSALITAEYQGKSYSFRADGWFNATEAAKRYGKRPGDWLDLPDTQKYLEAVQRRYGKIPYVETRRGGNTRLSGFAGTWLHPKLAVAFARWLDIDFELWCDEQIDKILHGEPLDVVDDSLTTATDRILIHKAVPFIYERTGACYPEIYIAISAAAGADNFPGMTMAHLERVALPLLRIRTESSTQADWDSLHLNGRAVRGGAQLELTFAEPALYNSSKESQ